MKCVLFYFKKCISRLFFTLTFPCCLLLFGMLYCDYLIEISVFLVIVVIIAGPLGQGLLWFLSRRYPQLSVSKLPHATYLIAVAGSGFQQHSRRVPESWFGDNLVIRLTEAGRIAQDLQKENIPYEVYVSMPEDPEMLEEKLIGLKAFFARFGVREDKISVVDTALDSKDEIEAFQKKRQPLIIVSNSWHVPRLMLAARYQKVTAYAGPAGQIFHAPKLKLNLDILPSGNGIQGMECALHEIMGIFQLWIEHILHL